MFSGLPIYCLCLFHRYVNFFLFIRIITQALGSGLNLHLKENDLLRDVLQLGEKISSVSSPTHRQSKLERVSSIVFIFM